MAVWSRRVHSTDTCLEVAQEICEEIGPEYLATPTHEEFKEQAELFKRGHGFLMCIRARDGTHIPIRGSFGRRKLVWCFTDFYSVVLQIVARADYHILTATADHAGKSNDSTIMKKKHSWQKREEISRQEPELLREYKVPFLFQLQVFKCKDDCGTNIWIAEGKISDSIINK